MIHLHLPLVLVAVLAATGLYGIIARRNAVLMLIGVELVLGAAGLLLVINGCVRSGRADVVAVAVGVWIGGAYFFTSSTSFANPAVTIARTLSDSFAGIEPASVPMFVLMQLAGAVLAFILIRFLYPRDHAHPPLTD